jgi:hypothetical protein
MAGRRSALCVGIDAYERPVTPLTSCVADAKVVAEVLSKHGDGKRNFDHELLLGDSTYNVTVSRPALRQKLANALDRARGRDFLFYFSGHGDVDAQFGPAIITQDGDRVAMDELLTMLNKAEFVQGTVILDCCYAGTLGQLAVLEGRTFLKDNIAIISASRQDEPAQSGRLLSAFTEVVVDGLRGGAADIQGHVTAAALFEFAAQSFSATDQSPVFRASIDVSGPLREVDPPVEIDGMKELPGIFGNSVAYTLEPEDVPTGTGVPTARQRRFGAIRRLRHGGLVQCDPALELTDVASESGDVRLTPRGRHALRLVEKDLV